MEAHYIGFNMWVKGVEKAGTTDPDAVIDALIGVSVPNLSGGYSALMPNHHITKPVLIGEIQGDGQFNIVSQTPGLVVAQEWSPYVADTKDLIGDWRAPMSCGAFNVRPASAPPARRPDGLIASVGGGRLLPGRPRSVLSRHHHATNSCPARVWRCWR